MHAVNLELNEPSCFRNWPQLDNDEIIRLKDQKLKTDIYYINLLLQPGSFANTHTEITFPLSPVLIQLRGKCFQTFPKLKLNVSSIVYWHFLVTCDLYREPNQGFCFNLSIIMEHPVS